MLLAVPAFYALPNFWLLPNTLFDYLLRCGMGVNNQSPGSVRNRMDPGQLFGNGRKAMHSAPTDRRVRRTRELLRRAFLSLLQEKGYDRITVQDILDRADIGRSTFYAHYRDKDDLLRAGFEDIRAALAAERRAAEQGAESKREFLQPLLAVFQHVGRHRHFWEPLSRKGGAELVSRILWESVSDLAREHLRSQFPDAAAHQAQFEAAVRFVAGACMGLLGWWLEDDAVPYTAEELHAIFRRLATQGVRRYLVDAPSWAGRAG
jgi:AcrR family transcriptional regulator